MKYANQINGLLALIGAVAVAYALTQTYFNPDAQPHVMIQMEPSDGEARPGTPAERSGPANSPLLGTGVAGVPTQSSRPSRTRTRPANTLRENLPVTPQTQQPRPDFQRTGPNSPIVVGSPPSPATRGDESERNQAFPMVQPQGRRTPQRGPAVRGRTQPNQPPQATPPPQEKRQNTPPPPARSSMP